jgi:diketogulonate reductase-like aldo/keto reductase
MSNGRTVTLNNGAQMPMPGLGTYRSGPGEEARRAVGWALEAGYRLIDTALAHWNQQDVAAAIANSGIARREIFLTSKLENDDQGYDSTLAACDRSLENLQTDYLDLYLVHWPVPELRNDTWQAMERLFAEGNCRAVGVSNYTIRHLHELLARSEIIPAVNQVEFHPFLYQKELLAFCLQHRGVVQAYSPLVKALEMEHPLLLGVARRYDRSVAQILLRWHLDREVSPIPESVQKFHILENFDIWDFSIDPADLQLLDALDERRHVDWDPTDLP